MDEKKDPVDILDEIMNRGVEPPRPSTYPPKFDPPPPEDEPEPPAEDEPTPPAEKRPSPWRRLTPWALGLTAAAIILFAVQLFSVNTRLDGLQAAVEGAAAADGLREDNKKLKAENQRRQDEIQAMETENQSVEARNRQLERIYEFVLCRAALDNGLDLLERFNRAGDWLMSATIVETLDQFFNEKHPTYDGQYTLPAQKERYLTLRETVFDRGGCMVVKGFHTGDPSDLTERPYIYEGTFDAKDIGAAKDLLTVLLYYPVSPDAAAGFAGEYLQPEGSVMTRLKAGAFQPSTLELAERVRDDLIQGGWLKEEEDGTLSVEFVYGGIEGEYLD